ncbi:RidA family protein [Limimaricola litoreus]|uniref:RidA family protein n=1 Tax=Limimaricola litoreus TaxID=2955316 RepID=A0A9X2JPJ6_9RHOB|nr:RidA family protein [Limimaricola litoreus]MCP1168285.1 RidA family protein [Limimaricola litoreus]
MTDIIRHETDARMSQVVVHNGIAYLAGQIEGPAHDAGAQTRETLAEIDRLLALAGTDKTRLLTAQIWLADMADFEAMNAAWDAWVPEGHAPARYTGESKLAAPEYRVEIIVTAAV